MAAFAVLLVLVQLVLAQLTLAFAVLFILVARVSRWHRSWLLAPAGVGLVWALAAGPGHVLAGFVAGPDRVLAYFGDGHLLGGLARPLTGFAGAAGWLPRQLPVALVAGAAEAGAVGWLDRRLGDPGRPALPPRPGPIGVLRGALASRMIRAGAVLTRDGCALGVVSATGAVAELRWTEIAGGAAVTGPVATEVTVACLQVVHAALRRRKPLIVIDPGDDAAIARAVAAACAATGTPLRIGRGVPVTAGTRAAVSPGAGTPDADADLVNVVSERSAVLLPAGSPRLADLACAEIAALAAELRGIGADGDGLIWVTAGESLPAQALAALIRDGGAAGLPVLIGATSGAVPTELAGSARTVLTLAPTTPSRRPWEFSLAVAAPQPREIQSAHMIPARLPLQAPARSPSVAPARLSPGAAGPGGRP
jgi:hypothetical protein